MPNKTRKVDRDVAKLPSIPSIVAADRQMILRVRSGRHALSWRPGPRLLLPQHNAPNRQA
jgi:hypothetical protein